jgi:hypothetical protein
MGKVMLPLLYANPEIYNMHHYPKKCRSSLLLTSYIPLLLLRVLLFVTSSTILQSLHNRNYVVVSTTINKIVYGDGDSSSVTYEDIIYALTLLHNDLPKSEAIRPIEVNWINGVVRLTFVSTSKGSAEKFYESCQSLLENLNTPDFGFQEKAHTVFSLSDMSVDKYSWFKPLDYVSLLVILITILLYSIKIKKGDFLDN